MFKSASSKIRQKVHLPVKLTASDDMGLNRLSLTTPLQLPIIPLNLLR